MNSRTRTIALAALLCAGWALPAAAQEKLTVWWIKSFYQAEDAALKAMIRKFERVAAFDEAEAQGKSAIRVDGAFVIENHRLAHMPGSSRA